MKQHVLAALLGVAGLVVYSKGSNAIPTAVQAPSRPSVPTPEELAGDHGLLGSTDGQRLLKYAVQCALPAGDSLSTMHEGAPLVLEGSLGLAPEWKHQALPAAAQRWLTACILSRINAFGVPVEIDMRGEHPALRSLTPEETHDYTFQEGAFYGNFFADPPAIYVCRGHGGERAAPTKKLRVCTEPLTTPQASRCGMELTGECADVCEEDPTDHSFRKCAGGSVRYGEVVTVFLKAP